MNRKEAAKSYYFNKYQCWFGIIIFGCGSSLFNPSFQLVKYPMFLVGLMFIAEIFCFLFILFPSKTTIPQSNSKSVLEKSSIILDLNLTSSIAPKVSQIKPKKNRFFYYWLLASIELLTGLLDIFCYMHLNFAFVVSLRLLIFVYLFIYRVFKTNKDVFLHEKLGLGLYGIGILIIILETVINKSKGQFEFMKYICILIVIISDFFEALFFIAFSKIIKELDSSPGEATCIRGIGGLLLTIILYIPVHFLLHMVYPETTLLDPFKELQNLPFLIVCIFFVFDLMFFNFFVAKTLKISDPIHLCTMNSVRAVVLWVVNIVFQYNPIKFIDIIGGLFICIGSLIYCTLIVVPCFRLKKSAKKAMEQDPLYRENIIRSENVFLM